MGSADVERVKREDFSDFKPGPSFSEWKILVGPSDWENYSLGGCGAERYRTQNLSSSCTGPGLYELGIAAHHTKGGHKVRDIDPKDVIPVYLGRADDLRSRLQDYGRTGSHLNRGNLISPLNENKERLFHEVFSRGLPIVFRCAPMESKKEAEKTETRLLEGYDFAWNKGGNGARRPGDIWRKLDKAVSGKTRSSTSNKKSESKKSIPSKEFETSSSDRELDPTLQAKIFSRSRPRLASTNCTVDKDYTMCGVVHNDGSVCGNRPIEGNKRCGEHKGQRVPGSFSSSLLDTGGSSVICGVILEGGSVCMGSPADGRKRCELHKGMRVTAGVSDEIGTYNCPTLILGSGIVRSKCSPEPNISVKREVDHDDDRCGVALGNGSVCGNRPIEGNKRCGEHKGQRVSGSFSRSLLDNGGSLAICGVILEGGSVCMGSPANGRKRCELHKGMRVPAGVSDEIGTTYKCPTLILGSGIVRSKCSPEPNIPVEREVDHDDDRCGVALGNGSLCRRFPVQGRKRCEQHKGMRATLSAPSLKYEQTQSQPRSTPGKCVVFDEDWGICGVTLGNGSFCRNRPTGGRKRCYLHTGQRISSGSFSGSVMGAGGFSDVCGVSLRGGSVCMRSPAYGRKRCEQHKGMRA